MKFKVGDRVQLRVVLPFDKAGRIMHPLQKGVVTGVANEDYTVEFDDSMTPIAHITESEIEPAKK